MYSFWLAVIFIYKQIFRCIFLIVESQILTINESCCYLTCSRSFSDLDESLICLELKCVV